MSNIDDTNDEDKTGLEGMLKVDVEEAYCASTSTNFQNKVDMLSAEIAKILPLTSTNAVSKIILD